MHIIGAFPAFLRPEGQETPRPRIRHDMEMFVHLSARRREINGKIVRVHVRIVYRRRRKRQQSDNYQNKP